MPDAEPDFVSLEGYIVGSLMVEALKRCVGVYQREALVDALEGIADFDIGMGTTFRFGRSDHQATHKVWGTRLNKHGQYQIIDLT